MQTDFSVGKCTRKCAVTGEPLRAGELFYSVVIGKGSEIGRQDIAEAAWTGPPAKSVGWWRSRMPDAVAKKLHPAPVGVLLDTLTELLERPGSESLAYLLALLLCRRRVLVDEESGEVDGGRSDGLVPKGERPEAAVWNLVYPTDGRQWAVPVAVASPDLLEGLQTQLNALLFTEV